MRIHQIIGKCAYKLKIDLTKFNLFLISYFLFILVIVDYSLYCGKGEIVR